MLGHVCQLHYYGGGVVAYHSENGKLARLQFHRGPCLKIGQAVTFSIVDGAAVDILTSDPSKEAVLKHARGAGSAHTLVERTDDVARPAASQAGALPQSLRDKRLQQEMRRFRNATAEEQLEWMDQTEAELQRLLEDGDGLDGDRLCRLVRRLPAWAGGARGYSARSKIFAAEGRCRTGFRPAAEANSPCADHRPAKHWPRGLQHAEMSWEPPGLYPGIVWSSWLCCLASHFSDAAVASASLADLRVGWCEGWAAWKEDVCCQSSTSCW